MDDEAFPLLCVREMDSGSASCVNGSGVSLTTICASYECPTCGKKYASRGYLEAHRRKGGCEPQVCPGCSKFFTRKHNFSHHVSKNVCGMCSLEKLNLQTLTDDDTDLSSNQEQNNQSQNATAIRRPRLRPRRVGPNGELYSPLIGLDGKSYSLLGANSSNLAENKISSGTALVRPLTSPLTSPFTSPLTSPLTTARSPVPSNLISSSRALDQGEDANQNSDHADIMVTKKEDLGNLSWLNSLASLVAEKIGGTRNRDQNGQNGQNGQTDQKSDEDNTETSEPKIDIVCLAKGDYIKKIIQLHDGNEEKAMNYIKNIGIATDFLEGDFRMIKKLYFDGKKKSQFPIRVKDFKRNKLEFLEENGEWGPRYTR